MQFGGDPDGLTAVSDLACEEEKGIKLQKEPQRTPILRELIGQEMSKWDNNAVPPPLKMGLKTMATGQIVEQLGKQFSSYVQN